MQTTTLSSTNEESKKKEKEDNFEMAMIVNAIVTAGEQTKKETQYKSFGERDRLDE